VDIGHGTEEQKKQRRIGQREKRGEEGEDGQKMGERQSELGRSKRMKSGWMDRMG
jgi:hypothetical protein